MIDRTQPLVLAVDDERSNLMLLERMFRNDYRIFCVQTAQAALDMLAQAPFDLILLDIMMPDVDGLTTLKRIRANPKTDDLPVILISALSDSADITRGFEIGANDYITKPIDMEVTRARVHTQITLKKLLDERTATITELRTAQEMKDRLLRMASHDLKGPLNNIRAASMLIGDDISCVREGETLLEAIETSADKMENVIKDFLDTAALQTGVLDLQLECLALEPLIKNVLAEYGANSVRKRIALETADLTGSSLGGSRSPASSAGESWSATRSSTVQATRPSSCRRRLRATRLRSSSPIKVRASRRAISAAYLPSSAS